MSKLPNCPQCNSEYAYEDRNMYICTECAQEWSAMKVSDTSADEGLIVKDSSGNLLQDGDSISVIKDLKVKGSSLVVKVGT